MVSAEGPQDGLQLAEQDAVLRAQDVAEPRTPANIPASMRYSVGELREHLQSCGAEHCLQCFFAAGCQSKLTH